MSVTAAPASAKRRAAPSRAKSASSHGCVPAAREGVALRSALGMKSAQRLDTSRNGPPSVVLDPIDALAPHERAVIEAARSILRTALTRPGAAVTDPASARDLALMHLAGLGHECFAVMFFDAQHCLLAFVEMFRGTLTQTSVHPREIVRQAMAVNAAAVILAHNHPSGACEASRADELLTAAIQTALGHVSVNVLDHLIVGGDRVSSFVESGLL